MDEIVKGVIETTSVPDNVEQLVKVNIKDGKASATLFANPNGSKIKQRLDNLEARFNNLKTINYEELYGPGNINIKQGGDSTGVTKSYVDTQDSATLSKANAYTDSKVGDLKSYVDNVSNTTLIQAKAYADSLSYGGGGGGGDKSTVVLIDAVGRASSARSEAYTAYKAGKAIVLKCAADKFIPMTVTAESGNSVDLKGFDLSYSGYTVTPNVTLVTRMWTLNSNGLNYVEKSVPVNSCRTFDCTNSSTIANTFADAKDASANGFSVILKVDSNTYVVANTVTSTSLTGYNFQFNTGTTSDGQTGIVSVDIIRWRLTSAGLSKDTFSTESSGSGGGGGSVTLRHAFSTKTTTLAIPNNPDDDPTFWNQSSQTSASIWAAQKSTDNDWVIWKLQSQDGTNGKGISKTDKFYGVSNSSTIKPTKWESTMPDGKPGEYIWTKVVFTYTDGTTDEYYTVSYIGTNGIDGKNGTSVNIIGSLDSKENLPTAGNSKGDGYLIDGNLWVYDGNTITSDITYNGFTNVGKISGPSPCFHVAWCNGNPRLGDYTGFDVDAPVGSQFDYMGTYVDYPENVSECPDSTNPADYTWTRIRGVDGTSPIIMDLSNESIEVALTYDGKVEKTQTLYCRLAVMEGTSSIDVKKVEVDAPSGINYHVTYNIDNNTDYKTQVEIFLDKDGENIASGSNIINITATATCLDGETTHISTKSLSIIGVKAGAPGESATTYDMLVSPGDNISVINGEFSNSYINADVIVTKGDDYYYLSERRDVDYRLTYSKDDGEEVEFDLLYNIDVTDVQSRMMLKLYINGKLRDHEMIRVNRVNDGEDGKPAIVVDTKHEYSVANTFTKTPSDLTEWLSDPIDIEPGQYLYIKTIRTWNNGDITYDYSWVRGGLNGYSNCPYVSTVFTRSASQPETPTGGDYNNPLPETEGWSDGVPDGSEKLWFSQRKFTIDGLEPQESAWSTPLSALSTSTLKLMYSSEEECPKSPDVAPTSVWSSIPDLNSRWMAMRKITDGIESPWVLLNITGEGPAIDTTSAATPFMGEWDASTKYYGTKLRTDIVRVSGESGADDPATYYYIANKAKNFDGVVTPKPGTTEGDKYWLRFGANYDNLATGFLFSEKIETDILNAVNAHIDDLDVDSLDAKIVNAINNGEGVINADRINADDLVAKRLRTSDSGERIIAESNRMSAFDRNNNIIFDVDPMSSIIDVNVDKDVVLEYNSTIYSRTYTGTAAAESTSTNTFGSITIPASNYVTILGCDDLRIGISAKNAITSSVVINKTIVELYYTINGTDYMFARCGLSSSINDGSTHICNMQYFNIRRAILNSTYVSIKSKVTHSAEGNGQSSLASDTTVTVSILNGSKFSARRDYGVTIGGGFLSGGQLNEYNHYVIGSAFDGGKAALDVASNGVRMLVSDDVYVRQYGIGMLPLLNPVVIDISLNPVYNSNRAISERDMFVIFESFKRGIPAYIKTSVYLSDSSQFVDVLARVNSVYVKSYITSAYDVVILATADLHRMDMANWGDSTDYRVNMFANASLKKTLTYDTANADLSGVLTVNTYIHTV